MYCSSCGAQLKDTDARCPYCGTINPIGAEAEYMDKLEDIREDTEHLADIPPEEYTRSLKTQSHFALKIALIVVGICIFIFLLFTGIRLIGEHSEKKQIRQEIAFEKEYLPKLNEIYALGDDDKTLEYLNELYEMDGSTALGNWKHSTYFYYYSLYLDVLHLREMFKDGTYEEPDLRNGFFSGLTLYFDEIFYMEYENLTAEELSKVESFKKESMEMFTQDMGYTEEEISDVYQSLLDDDFISYKLFEDYIEENKDRFL
ncbi:MAG: zinc ribbon domain-containing protein [Clostridia bacterium]|nr:zinc ribbon domain-containing protein [Clostridia bacterium]